MKIGMVVYSQTGNTRKVAQKLQDRLLKNGHTVDFHSVYPIGDVKVNPKDIKIQEVPLLEKYDAVILGTCVQAFNVAPAMSAYLKELPIIKNKKYFG